MRRSVFGAVVVFVLFITPSSVTMAAVLEPKESRLADMANEFATQCEKFNGPRDPRCQIIRVVARGLVGTNADDGWAIEGAIGKPTTKEPLGVLIIGVSDKFGGFHGFAYDPTWPGATPNNAGAECLGIIKGALP